MMMMMTMKKMAIKPAGIHFAVALFLVVSLKSSLEYGNTIQASFNDDCSDDYSYTSGMFYECGEPAGRCICQDHKAYCDVSSPALPVLPNDIYVLNLCNKYYTNNDVNVTNIQLSQLFFMHMSNVTELQIYNVDIRPEEFDRLVNLKTVFVLCQFDNPKTNWTYFFSLPKLTSFTVDSCWCVTPQIPFQLQTPFEFGGSLTRLAFSWSLSCLGISSDTLDLSTFLPFKELESLSVSSTDLKNVQPAVLPTLKELHLYDSELTSFPQTCDFPNSSYFPSLKFIRLSENNISHIGGNGVVTCLPQVTEIDLSTNPIMRIQRGVFDAESCPKLETINIELEELYPYHYRYSVHIDDVVFSNPSIKILNMRHRKWRFAYCTSVNCIAPDTFRNSSLTHLFLDGNDFSDVTPDRFFRLFGDLRSLACLTLNNSHFSIHFVDTRFCDLNLEYLDVSANRNCLCHETTRVETLWESVASHSFNKASKCYKRLVKIFRADSVSNMASSVLFLSQCSPIFQFFLCGPAIEQFSFRNNHVNFGRSCMPDHHSFCNFLDNFKNKVNLTILELDGNDFSTVDTERFVSLFGTLTNLEVLSLADCGIKYMSAEMFRIFPRLKYLDLSNNKLTTLSGMPMTALPMLTTLLLHGNVLRIVPEELLTADKERRWEKVTLYLNPLVCSCDNRWFQSWLLSRPDMFDFPEQSYICADDPSMGIANYAMPDQVCMLGKEASIAIIISCSVLITSLTAFTVLFRYRWHFRLLLYHVSKGRKKNRKRKKIVFDVFVSYDKRDYNWIRHRLMPELEDRLGLRLCIHERDFIPGVFIGDNIVESVEHSQKVLAVFSRNFVLSEWCQFEIEFCLGHVVQHGDCLLIVCLDDVMQDEAALTGAMKAAVETMTYIQWRNQPDAVHFFWERFRLALRDVIRRRERQRHRQRAHDPNPAALELLPMHYVQ